MTQLSVTKNIGRHLKIMNKLRPNLQAELFKYPWDEVEAWGCSRDQAKLLFDQGLASFNPAEKEAFEGYEVRELVFLKTLYFDSGLPKENVLAMLAGLEKPYSYSFDEIYWNFYRKEWNYLPAPEQPEIEELVDQLVEDEDFSRLKSVKESIEVILKENES